MSSFIDYKSMVEKISFLPLSFKIQEYLKLISMIESDCKTLKYVDSQEEKQTIMRFIGRVK